MCFGVILGWVLASAAGRAAPRRRSPAAPAPAAAAAPQAQSAAPARRGARAAAEGDHRAAIRGTPARTPSSATPISTPSVSLTPSPRYEQSLKIDPNDPDVSTDLGVSYYYTNRPDDALAQFDRSLKIDPEHTKTLLNKGIVLAFGKEDLRAAADEWKKVVELAPDSARRPGGPPRARRRGRGARRRRDTHESVIRYLLIAILVMLIARAFWRVIDGIMEAAGGTTAQPGQVAGGQAGARPGVRHVRLARNRAVADGARRDALLLLGGMSRGVPRS